MKAPPGIARLELTLEAIEESVRSIRENYGTVLELGYHAHGRGMRLRSLGGHNDPTGNVVASEWKEFARSAAMSAAGQADAALEALQRAQDVLADVISPRR